MTSFEKGCSSRSCLHEWRYLCLDVSATFASVNYRDILEPSVVLDFDKTGATFLSIWGQKMETGPVYILGQTLNEMPAQRYLCIFAFVILPLTMRRSGPWYRIYVISSSRSNREL